MQASDKGYNMVKVEMFTPANQKDLKKPIFHLKEDKIVIFTYSQSGILYRGEENELQF